MFRMVQRELSRNWVCISVGEMARQVRTWWGGAKHESTRSGIREETKNTDDSLNKERENCQRTSG